MPVYAENAKLNFSYDRRFLAISASLGCKKAKKSVDTHINFHLYHYAGNNPVKYVDPDGKETTVLIIHANTGWESLAKGSHAAIHFSNPGLDRYGDFLEPSLYDPSGSYDGGREGTIRPSSGLFSEPETSDLSKYIKSVLDRNNGEYIVSYKLNTSPEEESQMLERADELGDGIGFSCADNVSDVLKEKGFKHVLTPGGLERQLQKSELITEVKVYKNE